MATFLKNMTWMRMRCTSFIKIWAIVNANRFLIILNSQKIDVDIFFVVVNAYLFLVYLPKYRFPCIVL